MVASGPRMGLIFRLVRLPQSSGSRLSEETLQAVVPLRGRGGTRQRGPKHDCSLAQGLNLTWPNPDLSWTAEVRARVFRTRVVT